MCIYYHIVIIASCLKDSSPPFIRCSKPTSANHSPGSHAIAMMTTKTVEWLPNARSCAHAMCALMCTKRAKNETLKKTIL